MRYRYENHFYRLTEDQIEIGASVGVSIDHNCLPDFSDPATVGWVTALVRKAYGDDAIHPFSRRNVAPDMSGKVRPHWMMLEGRGAIMRLEGAPFATEIEALIAALEAAP